MTEKVGGQITFADLDGWSGKTCLEHSARAIQREKTSASSLKKPQGSQKKVPLFLELRRADGNTQDASWEMGGRLLGDYTMRSFGEKPCMLTDECLYPALPNGVKDSHLSQILQDTAHQKYFLSAKACLGILNRAEKRGKKLPEILRQALENQIHGENSQ